MLTPTLVFTLLVLTVLEPLGCNSRAFASLDEPYYFLLPRDIPDSQENNEDYDEYDKGKAAMAPLIKIGNTGDNVRYENWVRDWLERFDEGFRELRHEAAVASWEYNTNITEENAQRIAEQGVMRIAWMQKWRQQARHIEMERLRDPFVRRQLAFIGRNPRKENPTLTREIIGIHSQMQKIYNTGKVCVANGTCYSGEPELQRFMHTSRDYDDLLWAWKSWRDVTGPVLRPKYTRFTELLKEEALAAGYSDMGMIWRHELEQKDLEAEVETLYQEIRPLYLQLHAYVRHHLVKMYGPNLVPKQGMIPAHLLGNMWAQQWDALYQYVIPYPEYAIPDISKEMQRQSYTATRMFKLAEQFYTSLGMEAMTTEFWERSQLEKPADGRSVACHGSATNFFDGKDYRIRMCTEVTEQELCTVHHEMGHVEYFMAYRHLPVIFQDGANSAFHEAIGETVQYSVLTPEHLHHVHLLHSIPTSYKTDINFLLKQAMLKLPLIPFSLVMDRWRWDVFSGKIPPTKFNEGWWKLRRKYQGVDAPISRSEEDFDPGAKYHIPDNTPYIRYYLSSYMQIQFHEALCLAKHGGTLDEPIHRCDIYNSKKAGEKFLSMLRLGSSKTWQDAMETLTGIRQVSAKPLLRYYQPLYEWLITENKRLGIAVGWNEDESKKVRNNEISQESQSYYYDYNQ